MKLNGQEKKAVTLGVCVLSIILIWVLGVRPLRASAHRLNGAITAHQDSLQRMKELGGFYQRMSRVQGEALEGSQIFALLQQFTREVDLRAPQMRLVPGSAAGGAAEKAYVKVDFKELTKEEVCRYLEKIETSGKGLVVRSFDLGIASTDRRFLKATLEVTSGL